VEGCPVWTAFGLEFCKDTLIYTWIVMGVILAFSLVAVRTLNVERPSGAQNFLEMIVEFVAGFVGEGATAGRRRFLLEFLATLFLFILFSNFLGLLPGLKSPTNTLNTNLGLAVVVFILVQASGFAEKGIGYLKRFLHPGGVLGYFMMPISLLEELAKPITLSMRLYGNIFAGELIIAVLLQLLTLRSYVVGGFIPHVVWLAFGIFVGTVQAFIFMVLSLAYVGQATAPEEEHH
jgi:F-type H+-transporting ATPase subunit a